MKYLLHIYKILKFYLNWFMFKCNKKYFFNSIFKKERNKQKIQGRSSRKLRNQGYIFTRDWIGAVASRCFPYSTVSLASEQTLKDLQRSKGHHRGGEESGFCQLAIRTSPKFTTGVKYQFHQSLWPDQRIGNPNHLSPPISRYDFFYYGRYFC